MNKGLLRNSGTYVFYVMARDEGGVGPFNSTAKVTIIVLEATNSPPEWTIPPVDNMTITVLEVRYCRCMHFKVLILINVNFIELAEHQGVSFVISTHGCHFLSQCD